MMYLMDPFLTRLLIAVLVYFLFDLVIKNIVTDGQAARIFSIILLIACILYLFFGSFLPFK